jgi:DHA3 family macrolide efflux protein-like MFS transporter
MRAQRNQTAYARLFRNRSFMALWLGQTISFIGDYFYWLAIPIMVERLTGSALQVGMSIMASALPVLLLGPVAGVFVDRWDRKRTMIAADLLRALLVLACLWVKSPDQVWIYYVIAFAMSCISRFFFPARGAVLPLIVREPGDLLAANGLMQIVETVGLLAGPALAGFTIGLWGSGAAFVVDSASFLVSAAAIVVLSVPRTTAGRQATRGSLRAVWNEMREGGTALFGSRTMVGVLLCLSVVQLGLGAVNVVWVPYMQRTFGLGAEGLGAVDTAQGIGMALGGLLLGMVVARLSRRSMAGWGIVVLGVLIALIGVAPSWSLASLRGQVAAMPVAEMDVAQRLAYLPLMILLYSLLLGVFLVPAQSALVTMMQLAVPDLKRGRVAGAMNALTTSASLLSMAVAASLGEVIRLGMIYVAAGAIVVVAGVVGFFVLQEPGAEQAVPGEMAIAEAVQVPSE